MEYRMSKEEIMDIIRGLEAMKNDIIDNSIELDEYYIAEELYDIDNDILELQQELYELETKE